MALIDLERSVLALCFRAEPDEADFAELGDRKPWLLYRELVRNRLRKAVRQALKRSYKAAGEALFERTFSVHLDRQPPRTRYFREIVQAFASTAIPMWQDDPHAPAFLADLARYELAVWEVGDRDASVTCEVRDFAFDREPVLSPALVLLSLAHAVTRGVGRTGECASVATQLCVHRAQDDAPVRARVLDRGGFLLLQALEQGQGTASERLRRACEAQGRALDAAYVERACGHLADFIEAGIVLGSR